MDLLLMLMFAVGGPVFVLAIIWIARKETRRCDEQEKQGRRAWGLNAGDTPKR